MSEIDWRVYAIVWIVGFALVAIWWRFLRAPSWESQMIDFELRNLDRELRKSPPPPDPKGE